MSDAETKGNFISEWFGHRVYPAVRGSAGALADQRAGRCPFLTSSAGEDRPCVKAEASKGVCTISSRSNGPRQDWLVCPLRVLDSPIIASAVATLFRTPAGSRPLVIAAPELVRPDVQDAIRAANASGAPAFVFLQKQFGGEILIGKTDRSPELALDFALVEIVADADAPTIGRYGILEVQTMDFHGSYKHAVKDLKDALRLHTDDFHATLSKHQEWLSKDIEGPNIANVFKRTFYQMLLKFEIGQHQGNVGCVLAIPASVWDSWQRHLGAPVLEQNADGTFALMGPHFSPEPRPPRAWVIVFDIDAESKTSPNPVRIDKLIATDTDSISFAALKSAPGAAVAPGGPVERVPGVIRERLSVFWPILKGGATRPARTMRPKRKS